MTEDEAELRAALSQLPVHRPEAETEAKAALYTALAKAQGEFPTVPRDRTVTVRTRDGRAYTFSYAPLDTILEKVRPALAANGLAVTQLFQGETLVTTLVHNEGGCLTSALPVQRAGGSWQEFGSAITYARRYALVALLGIASEEDDDGNAATGNAVVAEPDVEQLEQDLLSLAQVLGSSSDVEAMVKAHRERNNEREHIAWLKRQAKAADEKIAAMQAE